jgi:hypothetical protein
MDSARCVEPGTPFFLVAHSATIFHFTCSLHLSFTLCQEYLGDSHFALISQGHGPSPKPLLDIRPSL